MQSCVRCSVELNSKNGYWINKKNRYYSYCSDCKKKYRAGKFAGLPKIQRKIKKYYCNSCGQERARGAINEICKSCYQEDLKQKKQDKIVKLKQENVLKTCKKCQKSKFLDDFNPAPRMGDGHANVCKMCRNAEARTPERRAKERIASKKPSRRLAAKLKVQANVSLRLHNNMRRRVIHHLSNNKLRKTSHTFDLVGYSRDKLKSYIESLFEPWMTWENWGKYDSKTWDNNNSSTWKWQIDHIIPISKFIITSAQSEKFKQCWALENLRPLSAKENILKSNKVEHVQDH